jgi:isocitrate/isopropylmalate dehydrogenase
VNILVLPGDDIGPEITAAALAVLERATAVYSLGLKFESRDVGMSELSHSANGLVLKR